MFNQLKPTFLLDLDTKHFLKTLETKPLILCNAFLCFYKNKVKNLKIV